MDGFAFRILTVGEFEFAMISIGMMVLSAGIAVLLYRPRWTMPRSAYFAALCVCVAAGELSFLLRNLFVEAVRQQQVGRLAFAHLLIWFAIGAVTGVISAARSRDAFGTMGWWPLVFVPFANLVLIFYRSREARPTGTGRRASNAVLVTCGLVLVGLVRSIPPPSQEQVNSVIASVRADTELRDNAVAYLAESKGLEATLKDMVANVPLPGNELSQMLSVEVHGDVVVTTTEIKDSNFDFDETWRDQNTERLCLSKNQAMLMKIGATLKNVYQSSSGERLSELTINTETCNAWREKKKTQIIAELESIEVPQTYGEAGELAAVSYKDGMVNYRFVLNVVPPSADWSAVLQRAMCNEERHKVMVQLGMTVKVRLDGAKAKAGGNVPLAEFIMDATSCPADPL